MPAYEIEIILNRQLADCLSIPVFITDTRGNLIFYNEPAEVILGKHYDETGEMPVRPRHCNGQFSPLTTPLGNREGERRPEARRPLRSRHRMYPRGRDRWRAPASPRRVPPIAALPEVGGFL